MNTTPAPNPSTFRDCWNHIGFGGDGSCPELAKVIHCHNCLVYTDAGRGLLDRETWDEYRTEWTSLLAQRKASKSDTTHSLVVFMLGGEHFALPTNRFREVVEARVVHRLPGRRNEILLGLVNVRGELQICVSLALLLGLKDPAERRPGSQGSESRMLVVEDGKDAWVFPVNKVFGTFRFDASKLSPVPATLENAPTRFSRGAVEWEGRSVGYLDEGAVFAAVRKGIA